MYLVDYVTKPLNISPSSRCNMIKDKQIDEAINKLAFLNIGFSFELSGMLCIRELDNGEFAVSIDIPNSDSWEEVYTELGKAIECFLTARRKYELGEDYEQNRGNIQIEGKDYEYYSFSNVEPNELWLVAIVAGIKVPVLVCSTNQNYADFEIQGREHDFPAIKQEKSEMIVRALVSEISSGLTLRDGTYLEYENGTFRVCEI